MVAKRTSHSRCKAIIYIAFVFFLGCENNEYTVVELTHKNPIDVTPVIEQQISDNIEYNIVDQSIIFYSSKEEIKDLIAILKSIDKSGNLYQVTFSWASKGRYSTVSLPAPVYIKSGTSNNISLFNSYWQIAIEPNNQDSVILTLKRGKNTTHKKDVSSIRLADGTRIKFKDETKAASQHLSQQYFIKLDTKTEINNAGLPEGLFVTMRKEGKF